MATIPTLILFIWKFTRKFTLLTLILLSAALALTPAPASPLLPLIKQGICCWSSTKFSGIILTNVLSRQLVLILILIVIGVRCGRFRSRVACQIDVNWTPDSLTCCLCGCRRQCGSATAAVITAPVRALFSLCLYPYCPCGPSCESRLSSGLAQLFPSF